MRVAVWQHIPPGGAKRLLQAHVTGLLERGHDVEIWHPPDAPGWPMALDGAAREHVVALSHDGPAPWFGPGRLPLLRSPRRLIAAMSAHAQACAREIDAGAFDVHLAVSCPLFGAPPTARYARTPSVLYLHEPYRPLYEARPDLPWVAPAVDGSPWSRAKAPARAVLQAVRVHHYGTRARFEVDNARAFEKLLVSSRFAHETVRRVYGRDATLCPPGVDTARFVPRAGEREDVVVGVGNLFPAKRADALVAAVARLEAPRPRVEWVAPAVDDGHRAAVEGLARRTGVQLRVRVAIADDELVELLGAARAVVYTPRLESFGLVPLEAAACGTPVIGIAQGGVRETVADGVSGLLVDDDGEGLTAALRHLLADPQAAEEMGRAGRRLAEERWTQRAADDRLAACLQDAAAR